MFKWRLTIKLKRVSIPAKLVFLWITKCFCLLNQCLHKSRSLYHLYQLFLKWIFLLSDAPKGGGEELQRRPISNKQLYIIPFRTSHWTQVVTQCKPLFSCRFFCSWFSDPKNLLQKNWFFKIFQYLLFYFQLDVAKSKETHILRSPLQFYYSEMWATCWFMVKLCLNAVLHDPFIATEQSSMNFLKIAWEVA